MLRRVAVGLLVTPRVFAPAAGIAAVAGAIAALSILIPPVTIISGTTVFLLADGGTGYQLPDGGAWGLPPDAGPMVIGLCPVGSSSCTIANGSGYEEHAVTFAADGGVILGALQQPSCACAGGGSCLFADGGPVGTGTYPASSISGPGCLPRVCVEFSWVGAGLRTFSGAPTGCQP